MNKFKNLSDAELINILQDYGIQHGPIVDSTRTLYEKKLYEYERQKKTFPGSAEPSYESRQKYSTREYDDNQVHTLKTCFGSVKGNYKEELQAGQLVLQSEAGTSRPFIQVDFPQPCSELHQTKNIIGNDRNPANVNQEHKMSLRKTGRIKGSTVTTKEKAAIKTRQKVCTANLLSATVKGTQKAEVKLGSPSTSRLRTKAQRHHKPEPIAEVNPNHLAMSLVPLLDKVPKEKMYALRHDLCKLITSYYPDAPSQPILPNTAAAPSASA
ncbi:emerin isoform X1 [Pyxicephalus adspersus]|uniref:emerin isoform X1 n=1 Tax=Pyxicephalus adspersus TaxID=30357 RepID=UPI003B5B1E8F